MAKQTINTGNLANDGSGDSLRSAFIKVNQNFTEVYNISTGAFDYANTLISNNSNIAPVFDVANAAFNKANTSVTDYSPAFNVANAAFGAANNIVIPNLSPVFDVANAAFGAANNAVTDYSPAFNKANDAYDLAVTSFGAANDVPVYFDSNVASYLVDNTDKVITGNTTINGTLTINGEVTQIDSNNIVYTDSIIELHTPSNNPNHSWDVDDGHDIGLRIHYYSSGDKNAALVLANDTKNLEWYVDGTETNGVFSGTYGNIKANAFYGNVVGTLVGFDVANSVSISMLSSNITNLGASVNAYVNVSTTAANNHAVSIGASSNAWSNSIALSVNAYVNVSTTAANNHANNIGTASNVYASSVGVAANNYAGAMANASNSYAASYVTSISSVIGANTVVCSPSLNVAVTTTNVNVNTEIVTATSHGFTTGDAVVYNAYGGSGIGGLTDGGVYYIYTINSNTFYVYDNYNNAVAGGSTGRKNLTSNGVNGQTFTSARVNLTYDLTKSDRVFVHTLPTEIISVNTNFTMALSNNQSMKVTMIFPPAIGSDCDLVATKVNGLTVTGETLTNGIKRNTNTYLNFTIVKIGGIYTIYNI